MLKRLLALLMALLIFLVVGCSEDSEAPEIPEQPFEPIAPVNPQPAEQRLFGITVSESSNGFLDDFQVARQAGIQVAELALPWNAVETAPGVYTDPGGVLAAMPFYVSNDISLLLTFAVINTVQSTVPDHLAALDWNSPELIAAFANLTNWVFAQLPAGLNVIGVSVGNEVDLMLDAEDWDPYGEFFQAAATHLHGLDAQLKVGVKTTVTGGLFGLSANNIKALNEHTDVVMLNYYLQDNHFQVRAPLLVHDDFTHIATDFPFREIWMTEVGYQSGSEFCASSQDQQAAFYHELFTAWDSHKEYTSYLMIDWLHDASEQQVAEWEDYYGSSDPAFLEYLATLGLRTHDGQDKNAWLQLKVETAARGWDSAIKPHD